MAYVQPDFVHVTKPSHIIPGKYYLLMGTVSNLYMPESYRKSRKMDSTVRLPPTIVCPLSGVLYHSEFDIGHFRVWFMVVPGKWKQGQKKVGYEYVSDWDLSEINVPEHGRHDHHLVRIRNGLVAGMQMLKDQNRRDDYGEMVGYAVGKRGY